MSLRYITFFRISEILSVARCSQPLSFFQTYSILRFIADLFMCAQYIHSCVVECAQYVLNFFEFTVRLERTGVKETDRCVPLICFMDIRRLIPFGCMCARVSE